MKKRLLAMLLAFAIVLVSIPFGTMQVSAAEIPDSMNLESISDATSITEGEWIDFSMWGMSYGGQGYTVTVPSGTENVTLTFKAGGDYALPYEDYYTGELTISGCWVKYDADNDEYTASGTGHACIENGGLHAIVLDVASMIEDGKMYGAYDANNSCAYILNFEYEEAAHTCSFGDWNETTAPSCTTAGEATRSCECGATETKTVDATGHSYSKVVTAPTCTTGGYTTYTCAAGDDSYTADETAATGHSFLNGSCSVCGTADPDYKTVLEIPDGMNLESISDATSITEGEWIDFSMWGMSYGGQGYTVTVPSGTENVTLTFKADGDYALPYEDYYTGELTISGCWVKYDADNDEYTASGAGHACIENGGLDAIVLDVASMVESEKMYGAYNSSNECAYILKFEYAEATDTPGDDNTGDVEPTVPFTAITTDDSTVIAAEKITFVKNVKYNGFQITFPYYHVKVPAGTTYIDVTYPESANATDYAFYADTTNWSGDYFYAGGTGRLPLNKDEMSFVSENGTAPYAVATETSEYRPIAFFTFEYEEGTTPEVPSNEPERAFTKITAGETVIEESAIEYKGIFKLGDSYAGDEDGYNYIHEVPYYMVTVPLGTENVDITYTADTKIMLDDPSATVTTARGYRTKIDESVDLTASATVYGTGFNNGYTKNSDGTQTVKTNVKDNTVKSDGYRWAITVEEPDAPFAAVTLFTFNYPEHEHSYNSVVTEPTCDKAGYTTHTCTLCFDSYKDNETEATGHNYKDVVTEPTCTEKGYTTYTCEICKKSYTADETEATGHTADGKGVVTDPTCTEKGYTTYTCKICEKSYTADETEATGHSYEEKVVASTCITKGYTLHTCSVCGDNYKDNETELTDHNYDENGCTVCGAPAEVDGVYQIGSEAALRWFETYVEAGNTTANAKLTADITVKSSWDGIGTSSKRFAGSFDGDGKTVTFTNATNGLFAYVKGASATNCAEIKNVTVDGAISGSNNVAGIAGHALNVKIENCINAATVQGSTPVAGIVGAALGLNDKNCTVVINNCGNTGFVEATRSNSSATGVAGIIGRTQGGTAISNCYNSGNVSGKGDTGGIAGYIQGYQGACTVTNCYNTGKIEGDSNTGGIIGNMYNNVTITNAYNTGNCKNAIAGNMYNKTAKVINAYYLATASEQAANKIHENFSATAKSAVEMSGAEFAALLGDAFQASCPSPVFTTQTAKDHTMVDGVCSVCNYGNIEKAEFTVTMPTDERIIVTGETKATEGEDYTFKVEFATGYMAGENFAVTVTNYDIVDNGDGTYTVKNVISDLTITVSDIVKAEFTVTLPGLGNGYVVSPAEGSTSPVIKGDDYSFTVEIKDGFKKGTKFAVKANGNELSEKDGVYTIKNVTEKYVITVEDVDIITPKDKVSVEFTFTKGQTDIYEVEETGTIMLMQKLDVPYFDLADYGLERYYYNPYCYLDKDGNEVRQSAGTRESAYGHITAMHALICATEVFYLGYDAEDAGTGLAYRDDPEAFKEAVSWTQDAGSSFVDLWDFGTNLNYYLNYTYPLGKATWGSTSDQILIKDGDIFTAHLITGSASGSNFPFFIVNDTNGQYDISDQATHYGNTVEMYDQTDRATVKQGENVEVTLYLANPGEGYTTAYSVQANKELYMVESYNLIPDLKAEDEWMLTDYVTDKDGKVVISTADLKPGTYYFAAKGGVTPGGQDLGDGFITKGGETGVAVFELTVKAGETPPAPETYTVKIPVADAYTVYGATEVEGGTDYTFTVKVNEGYEKGDNFAVRVNGVVIDAVDTDTYTVENVAADMEITVEGVEEIAQTPTTPEVKPGDFDGDGSVTMLDVSDAFDAYMNETELTQTQKQAADFNNNGIIDMVEVSDVFDIYMNE